MNGVARKIIASFSVFLGFILYSNISLAQTAIQGILTKNATWNADRSPFVLSGDVVLANGASLTIEKNVTVVLTLGSKFRIKGRLDAIEAFFNGTRDANNAESLIYLPGSSGRLVQCAFLDLSLVFESSGIQLTSSVVSNRNGSGVTVGKESFPHIADNNFNGNSYFAVYRIGKIPLDVINCFWGSPEGPSEKGHGGGDAVSPYVVYRPFKSQEDINFLLLTGTSVTTTNGSPVKSILLTYNICNLNSFDQDTVLGASLIGADPEPVNHPESDIRATIPPGFHEYTRNFILPSHIREGVYDVHWSVMNKDLSKYHTYVKQREMLEILDSRSRTKIKNQLSANSDGLKDHG